MKLFKLFLLFFVASTFNLSAQSVYYVSPTGNDSNAGTKTLPYLTITKAISVAVKGDTIFVRGGTYVLTTTISIGSSQSGTSDSKYYLFAYPGERPLLDFSSMAYSGSNRGIYLRANFWYIKGFDIKGAGDNGMNITGSYNTIEYCALYENRDSGMQLGGGASNNRIINCDSYYNADPPDYADADGFAPKIDVGSNNYFYGCRSWNNCDDGWDGYMKTATDASTILENCWTWKNGYLKNGTDPGSQANGNGFKMGGSDDKTLVHNFILKNCLSFDNKAKGFDQNNNKGSMTLYNCTGYRNGGNNYSISGPIASTSTVTLINCAELGGKISLGAYAVQQTNSWMVPVNAAIDADFASLDTTAVRGPRKPDGSLPDINFMHLSANSNLIDKGVNVGIPFTGSAPDLGAFEYGMAMPTDVAEKNIIPTDFQLEQNFPNPFNPETVISYRLPVAGQVTLKVFDALGREIVTLVNEYQNAGIHNSQLSIRNYQLSSGVYFYQLKSGSFVETKKMLLMK